MDINSRTIYVENFPLDTTEANLRGLFKNFGNIVSVDLPTFPQEHPLCKGLPRPKTKGYAFIEFQTAAETELAYKYFNDLNIILGKTSEPIEKFGQSSVDLHERISRSPGFRDLRYLRVMSKRTHSDLSRRYADEQFKCLVEVAKLFVVAG